MERIRGGGRVLKAHSRLFEHLALVTDLVLIAGCWLGAYVVRFHVFGHGDIPPFSDYALQLVPILIVWGVAYKTFDLYRPNRLGSHLACSPSEPAKPSALVSATVSASTSRCRPPQGRATPAMIWSHPRSVTRAARS